MARCDVWGPSSPVFAEKQCWYDGEGGGGQRESREDGDHGELHWQLADLSETSMTVAGSNKTNVKHRHKVPPKYHLPTHQE